MSTPRWQQLGFLTPDAYECQQDLWALAARLRLTLADMAARLAERSAEPTWAHTLSEAATRSRALAEELHEEAGDDAALRLAEDEQMRELMGVLDEVVVSEHPSSLLVTGYAVLGELGSVPIRLLQAVAGPYAGVLCGRIVDSEDHQLFGRLYGIAHHDDAERNNLRRLLRHLGTQLYGVFESWRQTLHTLGIDGELLAEEARTTVQGAYAVLGLDASRADLAPFR